jgi:preprotein translocase subunit Sss1
MEKRYLKAAAAILVVFAIGLVGFYVFSSMYGDGLEKTMEDSGVSEGEPVYHAPLDYGGDYATSLIMGLVGFAIVMLVVLLWWFVIRTKKAKRSV